MGLKGTGFLAIWHGLEAGHEQAFEAWHTVEHLPERLGIPGFLRGRRYMNWQVQPRVCFTLYEASHPEVFRSPGYLARLNAPTPWSQQVQPHMVHFLRGACETVLSLGDGLAGSVLVVRLLAEGTRDPASIELALRHLAVDLNVASGVTGVHVGRHRHEVASAPTGETALRPVAPADPFDVVLIVEALDAGYAAARIEPLTAAAAGAGLRTVGADVYHLSRCLESPGA